MRSASTDVCNLAQITASPSSEHPNSGILFYMHAPNAGSFRNKAQTRAAPNAMVATERPRRAPRPPIAGGVQTKWTDKCTFGEEARSDYDSLRVLPKERDHSSKVCVATLVRVREAALPDSL